MNKHYNLRLTREHKSRHFYKKNKNEDNKQPALVRDFQNLCPSPQLFIFVFRWNGSQLGAKKMEKLKNMHYLSFLKRNDFDKA